MCICIFVFLAAGKLLSKYDGQLPTRLWIAPPTRMDQEQLIGEGYYATYGKVGARTEMPGCSLCMGNQVCMCLIIYVYVCLIIYVCICIYVCM